ncbi:hypothetical protein NIIDMKKI_79470 [Mycobacterium kansasii]|uniref:Uncharacterized protein n=1 Tax=Mycobacterium kansasii TaxID=1768 RepID=A0A7G1IP47_MYCKA|nr:hypothetical protein NIIDMKKI_79470 [Mycobacterium kansasii]
MTKRRVIFPPDDYWNGPYRENTVTDRINRITTAPLSELPLDLIRAISSVHLMIGAAPDGHSITAGLLFKAPAPIGAVEFMLTGPQLADLYEQLHDFVQLTHEELAALRDRLHGDDAS